MPVDQALAAFKDRHTLVYARHYPHEIGLVFEAVSTGEHLDEWLLPESRVERRLGGACAFGWGSSADDPAASRGTVTVFDPPTTVEYTFEDGASHMRFDLSDDGAGGTYLNFTLHFLPDPSADSQVEGYPGGDLPAPGTAWRPGFVAGYHEFLDDLRTWLAGELDLAAKAAQLAAEGHGGADWERYVDAYRDYIRDNCPPE